MTVFRHVFHSRNKEREKTGKFFQDAFSNLKNSNAREFFYGKREMMYMYTLEPSLYSVIHRHTSRNRHKNKTIMIRQLNTKLFFLRKEIRKKVHRNRSQTKETEPNETSVFDRHTILGDGAYW